MKSLNKLRFLLGVILFSAKKLKQFMKKKYQNLKLEKILTTLVKYLDFFN